MLDGEDSDRPLTAPSAQGDRALYAAPVEGGERGAAADVCVAGAIGADADAAALYLRVLADHAPDWDYWIGPDGRFRYVSPACEAVCGYLPGAFLADADLFRRLIHPEDLEQWDRHLAEPTDSAESLQLRLRARDGRECWIEHCCRRVLQADGTDLGRRGVNRDITHRKSVERELASLARLYATLSQFNQALLRVEDESGLFAELCRIAVHTGGLKACVISLCGPDGALTPVASEGIDPQLVCRIPLASPGGGPVVPPAAAWSTGQVELCRDCAGGRLDTRWREWAAQAGVGACCHHPFDRGGRQAGLVSYLSASAAGLDQGTEGVLRELTRDLSLGIGYYERREAELNARRDLALSEARYRALVQAAPVGIAIVRDRIYVEVNERMCQMVGYPREALVGQSTQSLLGDDANFRRVGDAIYPLLARQGSASVTCRLVRADGQSIEVLLSCAPLDGAAPNREVVSTLLDLTQTRRDQALLEARVALSAVAGRGDLKSLLQVGLDAAERVTGSALGFAYLSPSEDGAGAVQVWSEARRSPPHVVAGAGLGQEAQGTVGIRADAMHQGKLGVSTDRLALEQGYGWPEGQAPLSRELVVPAMADGAAVAVLGVGDKVEDYTQGDRDALEQILSMVVGAVEGVRAQEALRQANARLLEAQRLAGMGDWSVDLASGKVHWSREARAILGFSGEGGPAGLDAVEALVHPDDRDAFREDIGRALTEGVRFDRDLRLLVDGGQTRHVRSLGRVERDAVGRPAVLYGIVQDIGDRKETEERLRQHARVFESTSEGVMITDAEGRILAVNRAFSAITGYAEIEVLGKNPRLLSSGRHDRDFYRGLWASLAASGQWRGEIWNRRKDGSVFSEWLTISAVSDADGHTTHYVSVFSDITPIKRAQERLDFLAHHDALTGLPNRVLFRDRLDHAVLRAQREGMRLALLFLDLDGFKGVNDTLGHAVGDRLLEVVAERLGKRLRASDTLGRLGGDEFVIVLEGDTGAAEAASTAEVCLRLLAQPIHIAGHEIFISGSIGISLFPADGQSPEALMASADLAMYRAKAEGRNTFQFYVPEMTAGATERQHLENALRGAIPRGEMRLHYQIQVELHGRSLCGVEALARWVHPRLGLVAPGRFVPIAEGIGIVAEIDEWALVEACRQLAAWRAIGFPVPRVSVNCSRQALERGSLLPAVRRALAETGLQPGDLMLEVSESALTSKGPRVVAALADLSALGIGLALDDFGTGYSALGRLNRIPIDQLKVDVSFIRDIGGDPKDEAVARALVGLGNDLALDVMAEGVEREDQVPFLIREGCRYAQGYLFGMPSTPDELSASWGSGSLLSLPS